MPLHPHVLPAPVLFAIRNRGYEPQDLIWITPGYESPKTVVLYAMKGDDAITLKCTIPTKPWMREISILDHLAGVPGVPELVDAFRADDHRIIASRYVEGTTLTYAKRDASIQWDALEETLDSIHARDIVHLDVRPNNILINAKGQTTLIDYDLARRAYAPIWSVGISDAVFGYWPERHRRLFTFATPAMDVYSLQCCKTEHERRQHHH